MKKLFLLSVIILSSLFAFSQNKKIDAMLKLYEAGKITYMRTDSVNVSRESQQEARQFIDEHYGSEYSPPKPPVFRTKAKAAQEAHEAVRPTSPVESSGLVVVLLEQRTRQSRYGQCFGSLAV